MISEQKCGNVVITGIGMVTPLGDNPQAILKKILDGESAVRKPSRFETAPFFCKLSAEIENFDPEKFVGDSKTLRLMNRDAVFAVSAARLAVQDSGIKIGDQYKSGEVALYGATGLAGIALEEVAPLVKFSADAEGIFDPRRFGETALNRVRPTLSFKILSNMPICFVSIFEGITGPNAVFNPWEGQGAYAVIAGIRAIVAGNAACALVGGCDVKAHELSFISLQQQGVFESWAKHGKGCTPAEGAAFLVLEREDRARSRNARIYARISRAVSGTYSGTNRLSFFNELPAELCKTSRKPFDLEIIGAEDGNPEWEKAEAGALKKSGIAFSRKISPKPSVGNMFAAAAGLQMSIGALLARDAHDGGKVMVNCFGFGSEQTAFLLEPPSSPPQAVNDSGVPSSVESRPRRRVVVTGLGVVGPVGNNVETFWQNLTKGISGTGSITLFDASTLRVRIGGEVKNLDMDGLRKYFPQAGEERDRKVWLGLSAAREALENAGLILPNAPNPYLDRASIHVGVSLEVFFLQDVTPVAKNERIGLALARSLLTDSKSGAAEKPLQTPLDRMTQIVGDKFGINGGRFVNCSACAAGAQVIGDALGRIRDGMADVALAGAADSMLNPLGLGGFSLLHALSARNDEAESACRPFDVSRDGAVLGEGGGFLVLESLEHAKKRGAKIYAEILGYGSSMDAYRVSDPEPTGRGAVACMTKAIADAGLEAKQIDCVNAHGTGTPKNDVVETAAIKEVLGDQAKRIPVHSVKSMTGHLIAASGSVEAVTAVLTIFRGIVPPTINLRYPDPECDLDYVSDIGRVFNGKTVMSNSFAFGGQNAAIIFGKYTEGGEQP